MIPFVDINSGEFLLIVIIALVVIGPKRLPEYTAKLRTWIRQVRDMAEGAKSQLKDEMGDDYQEIDWRQYDPRQYDPRKIVREALFDDPDADVASELGLTDRQTVTAGAGGATGATAAGAAGSASGVGAEGGVGAEAGVGVGAEDPSVTSQPVVPRLQSDATYSPDRATPYDVEAT